MPSTTRDVNLYCKNGYLLQIGRKGEMSGTHRGKNNEFAVIKLSTVDHGVVTLQAAADGMYVAINNMGKVQTKNKFTEDCLFYEELNPANGYISYRAYQSSKCKYYLGISRRGKIRPANKILPDQNCAKFLHLNACDAPEEKKTEEEQIEREKIEKVLASHILMQEVSRKVGLTKSQKQEARTEELKKKKLEQPVVPETTIPSERKRKKKKQPVKEALDGRGQESDGKPEEKTKEKEVNQAKKRTSQSTDKDKEGKIDSNAQMAKKHRPSETKENTGNIQKQVENKNTASKAQQQSKEKEQTQKKQKQASSKESDGIMNQQQADDGGKHEVSAAHSQIGKEDEKKKTPAQDNKLTTKEDYKDASDNVSNEACTSYITEQVDESVQKNYGESEIENKSKKNDAIPVKKQDQIPSSGDHSMKQQETAASSYQSEMPKKQEKRNSADKVEIKDQIEKEVGMKETDFQTTGDKTPESISQSTCKNNQSQHVTQNEKGAVTKVPNTLQEIILSEADKQSALSETADVDQTRSDVKKKEKKPPGNDNKTEKQQRLKTEKKDQTKKKDANIDKQATKSGKSGHDSIFETKQKTDQTDDAATKKLEPLRKKQEPLEKKPEATVEKQEASEKKQEPLEKKPEATVEKQEASEKKQEASVKKQKGTEKKQDTPKKKQESLEKKTGATGKKQDASGGKIEPFENKQKAAEKKSETSKSKQKATEKKQEAPGIKQEAQTLSSTKQNKQGQSGKKQNKQELLPYKSDKQEASDETQDKQEPLGTKQDPLNKQQEKSEPSNMKQKEQEPSENKQEPSKKKQKKQQPSNKKEEKQQSSDKKKQDNQEPLGNKQDKQEPLTTLPEQQVLLETDEPPGKKQNKGDSRDREPKHHEDVSAGESGAPSQKGSCQTETEQSTSEPLNTGKPTKDEQHTKKNKKKNKQKTNNRQKADANATFTAGKSAKLEDENSQKQDSMIKTDQTELQNAPTAVSAASAPEKSTAVAPTSVPEQTTIVRDPFNVSKEIDVINQPSASAYDLEPMAEENGAVFSKQEIEPEESQQEQVHEVNNNQVVDVANHLHSSQQVQESTPSSIEHAYNAVSKAEETQSLVHESQMFGACLDNHQISPLAQSQLDPIGKNIPTPIPMWSDIAQQQPSHIDQQQVVIGSADMTQQPEFTEQTVTGDATNTSQVAAGQISIDPRPTETGSILSWSDIVQQSPPSVATVAEQHTINEQTSNNDIVQSCQEALTRSNLPTDQPKLESDIPPPDVQKNNSSPPVELPMGQLAGEITQNEPPTWSDIVQHSSQQDVQEQSTRANNIQSEQQVPDQALSPIDLHTDQAKSASLNKSMPTNSFKCEEGNTQSVLHELTLEAGQEPIQVTDKDKDQVENVPTFSDILQEQSLQQSVSKQEQDTEGCHGTQSLPSVPECKPDICGEFTRDSEETPAETESEAWEELMRSASEQQEPDPLIPAQTEPDIWEELMRDPEDNQDPTSANLTKIEDTQDTNNNTAEDGDLQLVGQSGRSQISKERVQSSNEPQQDHFEDIESKVAQPSVQPTEVLAKPSSQTHPQDKVLDATAAVPSLQPQTCNLTPSIPPKTVLPDPSPVTAIPLPQAPVPMDTETSAMPYDHPWSADFNQQPPVNIPLAPAPNIWEEYMGAAGGATDIAQDQSDVWDKYMMPGGLICSSPDAGTMQFAHAFFKDDISHDQQQLEQAYHQQITSQQNQQPGNASSFGQSVDSLQRQEQSRAGQSLRSEEQHMQATTQSQLMQKPQDTAFSGDSLGQPVPSQHQGQAVVHNVGTNNMKQPDLVAGMGQMAPMDNAPLSLADPWVMRQDVPVASPTNTNTRVNVGTPVDEAFEASGFDELHID